MRSLVSAVALLGMAGAAHASTVEPLALHALAGLPGKEGAMVVVTLAPGESDPAHRHNANVFVYVLEGSVVMQVKGGDAVTLHPGQTFYEGPDDIHVVGRNASASEPAKFIAFFVKDVGAPPVAPAE